MIRFLFVFFIFSLPTVAGAANCNVNLSATHTYQDLREMLVCLKSEIETLKKIVGSNSSASPLTRNIKQAKGCLDAMPGERKRFYQIIKSKPGTSYTNGRGQICWKDGEIFLDVYDIESNRVKLIFPGLKDLWCGYNNRCVVKENPDANFVITPKRLLADGNVRRTKIVIEISQKSGG